MSARIWVVDDDRSVRFVLATALRDAGYAVDGFESASSVLAALDTRTAPDLLFTDVRMPGDDGRVLLDKLKLAHPQLPVIVMSAYTDVASTAGAFRGGATSPASGRVRAAKATASSRSKGLDRNSCAPPRNAPAVLATSV